MKALVLAPPMVSIGGIQRYTATLARALCELLGDREVRLLAVPEKLDSSGNRQERLDPGVKARFAGEALRETARWQPDLIICAHVGLAPLGWLLHLFSRRPYWLIAYGIEVWGELSLSKRLALRGTHRLLAISNFTRQEVVRRYDVPPERAVLLPPIVESRQSVASEIRAAIPVPQGRRIVLTVSRLASTERYKGHDVVLRAWRQVREKVPEAVYLVVGDGDDRPRLAGLARELGLEDSVCFAGAVSEDVLEACYEACDVFAMPARTVLDGPAPRGEGFGIAFLEALAHGKPVVGPNFGAPAEFIRHGEHGLLVDPEDPGNVAEALGELLKSPDRARAMGKAGRQWAIREYGYERFRQRLRELLDTVA